MSEIEAIWNENYIATLNGLTQCLISFQLYPMIRYIC